jgi:hypothetical protein
MKCWRCASPLVEHGLCLACGAESGFPWYYEAATYGGAILSALLILWALLNLTR